MSKRRIITVAAGLVMVASFPLVLLISTHAPPDPVYQGKRLSTYLQAFANDRMLMLSQPPFPLVVFGLPSSGRDQAWKALPHFGTNAWPLLTEWLKARDSMLDHGLIWLEHRQSFIKFHWFTAGERQAAAVTAFKRLGHSAEPALPTIVSLLSDPGCARAAVYALYMIQPKRADYILALTNVIDYRGGLVEMEAMAALSSFRREANGAVPVLVDWLKVGDPGGRPVAAVALAWIGAPPEQVVPLIVRNLQITKTDLPPGYPSSTELNLWALVQFGGHSQTGFLMISKLAIDLDPQVRDVANSAIKRVFEESPWPVTPNQ